MNDNIIRGAVSQWTVVLTLFLLAILRPASSLAGEKRNDNSISPFETINLAGDTENRPLLENLRTQFKMAITNRVAIRKQPPTNPTVVPQHIVDRNDGTSFENLKVGKFETVDSRVGTWELSTGGASIDDRHAKTGKHCLHLSGGHETEVVLKLANSIKPDGELSFSAERWTSRSPFRFRISKKVGRTWNEIYNGDKAIKAGRSFRSNVKVNLGDPNITHLRFNISSPENTGILIDDFRIASAKPQSIASIEAVPFTLPALVGRPANAVFKLKVTTEGSLNPISITGIQGSLVGDASSQSIKTFQPYFGGHQSGFHCNVAFGKPQKPKQGHSRDFHGNQKLVDGDNYIWLASKLKDDANIDQTITAKINSITFSNDETKTIEGKPSVQRMGLAVRCGGDDGVHTYRIPGMATTNDGTLIGVYDVRRDTGGDLPGNIDVGMSRSANGGRTWDPMQVIMNMGIDPKWRGDGIGDPTVLVDRKTGTIWVSATWSHGNRSWFGSGLGLEPEETGQWILVKSDDDGVTWSKPINITEQIKKTEWSFLLQGPGKGITMSDGTIVFPAQYQDAPNKTDKIANRLPHSTFIYSRDNGKNWQIGTGAWDDTTEAQIVELAKGELMLNCRNNRASKRAIMTTTDMGKTWKEHSTHLKDLIEPGSCMASLINVGRELGSRGIKSKFDNQFLLFSNPNSLRGRNHMTIKVSQGGGATWPIEHQVLLDEQGGAGYSCMSMIDAETVGILYEGSQAQMTFQRIKINDILNPPKNQKTRNPAFSIIDQPKVRANLKVGSRMANAYLTTSGAGPSSFAPNKNIFDFARPFTNHMVLQREQPLRIWGTAKPGSPIEIILGSLAPKNTKTDDQGRWLVELPPQKASFEPTTLTAINEGGRFEITDVLVGEVWICAGQSNMEFELRKSTVGLEEIAAAGDNFLRLHNCPGGARGSSGTYSAKHMARLWPENFSEGQWQVDSANSAASFSAVGYYFAKRLREELDVPIGMINVSVGGTPIESWVSPDRLKRDQNLAAMFNGNWLANPVLDKWCKRRAKSNLKRAFAGEFDVPGDEYGPNHSFKPGFMFEAGIKPFSPLSIRGGLWYQGESNCDNPARIQIYDACFPLLVEDWRERFQNKNLPVIFVQLPAMGRPNWPVFREYQRRSLENFDNVGMAITFDTGHPTNVHPTEKQPVGNRLAQWALVEVYGQDGIPMGPIFKSKSVNGNVLEISFNQVGRELATNDDQPPNQFEIAGADGVYNPADARIVEGKIQLTSRNVRRPLNARYSWEAFPNPAPNLVNSAGLPASPFTTEESFH